MNITENTCYNLKLGIERVFLGRPLFGTATWLRFSLNTEASLSCTVMEKPFQTVLFWYVLKNVAAMSAVEKCFSTKIRFGSSG